MLLHIVCVPFQFKGKHILGEEYTGQKHPILLHIVCVLFQFKGKHTLGEEYTGQLKYSAVW